MRIAFVLVLLALGRPSHADDASSPAPVADTKSPAVAAALSIGATLVGGVWIGAVAAQDGPRASAFYAPAAILVVGPSLGHAYTGSYGLGAIGAAARVGGYLAASAGAGTCMMDPNDIDGCIRTGRNDALFYGGVALMIGGTLAELVDAPLSAKRYIREHTSVSVAPVAAPGTMGLAVVGSF